ncbi:MAG: acyltransferase family protein, partial [Nitrososphaerales archaeon]
MKEIPEITGMRGYASLSVVIFHFFTLGLSVGIVPVTSLVTSWNSGVDFFFVLSGFLLSIPFLQSGKNYSLKTYYLKRIFRILPVYYLNLVVVGTILVVSHYATLQELFAGLVFAQSFSQTTFNSINGVNWTLVIEEIFYVTLPLFSILFTKNRWKYSLPACVGISLVYRLWVVQQFGNDAFHLWQYPSFLGHYAVGLTLANLYVNRKFFVGK